MLCHVAHALVFPICRNRGEVIEYATIVMNLLWQSRPSSLLSRRVLLTRPSVIYQDHSCVKLNDYV